MKNSFLIFLFVFTLINCKEIKNQDTKKFDAKDVSPASTSVTLALAGGKSWDLGTINILN